MSSKCNINWVYLFYWSFIIFQIKLSHTYAFFPSWNEFKCIMSRYKSGYIRNHSRRATSTSSCSATSPVLRQQPTVSFSARAAFASVVYVLGRLVRSPPSVPPYFIFWHVVLSLRHQHTLLWIGGGNKFRPWKLYLSRNMFAELSFEHLYHFISSYPRDSI